MTTGIFILLLFFLPLLVVPFGYSYFEFPKVICAQVLIEVLFVTKLIKGKLYKPKFFSPSLLIPSFLLFLLTIIDLIFMRTQTTFWGNTFRFQGIFLLWHLLLLALISSQMKMPKIPFVVFLLSLVGLLGGSLTMGTNQAGRVIGTLGEPNALAASGIFLFPFLFFAAQRKIVKLGCFLLVLSLVLLSGSRAGLVALIIQAVFLLLSRFARVKWALLVCLLLLGLSLTFPFIENSGWYENRSEVWWSAIVAGSFNPILGAGFGNVEEALLRTSQLLNNNLRFQYVDSSHNFLLDFWVEGGIVGVLLIGFLLFKTFKNFVLQGRKIELMVLLGVITVMLFNPVSVVTLVQFWWLIGQGFRSD